LIDSGTGDFPPEIDCSDSDEQDDGGSADYAADPKFYIVLAVISGSTVALMGIVVLINKMNIKKKNM